MISINTKRAHKHCLDEVSDVTYPVSPAGDNIPLFLSDKERWFTGKKRKKKKKTFKALMSFPVFVCFSPNPLKCVSIVPKGSCVKGVVSVGTVWVLTEGNGHTLIHHMWS